MAVYVYEDRDGRVHPQSTESGRIIEQDAITRQALAPKRSRRLHNARMDSENWHMNVHRWLDGDIVVSTSDDVRQSWIDHDDLRQKQKAASWCKSIRESIPDEKC